MKADLHRYLRTAREALLWKLEGLNERDLRRPLTPTGTNLLGLVKHLAAVELGYFGDTFGRSYDVPSFMAEDADDNADMWASEDESVEDVLELYRWARELTDQTIETHDLDDPGRVPWWGERGDVSLHLVLLHVVAETNRHLGHADLVRELVDGSVGLRRGVGNLPDRDEAWWRAYRERLEQVADAAGA